MTVSESVATFLKASRPKAFCDDHIADELGKNRRQIQAITVTLAETSDFSRKKGGCSVCSSPNKYAIRSN